MSYIAGGNGKRVQSGLGTTVGLFRRKPNRELPHDPAILLQAAYPKEVKTSFETDNLYGSITAALLTTA